MQLINQLEQLLNLMTEILRLYFCNPCFDKKQLILKLLRLPSLPIITFQCNSYNVYFDTFVQRHKIFCKTLLLPRCAQILILSNYVIKFKMLKPETNKA